MTKWLRLIVGLLSVLGSGAASAQLYSRDSDFGVNTVVVDTRTGLSWLQLSQSVGLSRAEIWDSRSNGWVIQSGQYQGYRVALQGEVGQLFSSYVNEPMAWSEAWTNVSPEAANRALDLITLFGGFVGDGADGLRGGGMAGNTIWGSIPTMDGTATGLRAQLSPTVSRVWADNYLSAGNSVYLIAPVPEPSTYALMLVGLAAIAFLSRRRHSKE